MVAARSICESLSALCTSSLEYVSAVSGLHSLSEAMLLFSLSLFRLVSSEHYLHLLVVYRKRVAFMLLLRFYTMTPNIITFPIPFVKRFF